MIILIIIIDNHYLFYFCRLNFIRHRCLNNQQLLLLRECLADFNEHLQCCVQFFLHIQNFSFCLIQIIFQRLISTSSTTTSSSKYIYEATFVRELASTTSYDTDLTSYSGGMVCFLSQSGSFDVTERETFVKSSVSFSTSSSPTCHSSCSS